MTGSATNLGRFNLRKYGGCGTENMISLPLKFDEVESVEEFVNMVKRLDYDVDVKIGRCVFDAKSLMSVLMIAGNPDAVVEAHTNDIEAFKKKFKNYLQ